MEINYSLCTVRGPLPVPNYCARFLKYIYSYYERNVCVLTDTVAEIACLYVGWEASCPPPSLPWKIALQKATARPVVHKRRLRMARPPLVFELQVYLSLLFWTEWGTVEKGNRSKRVFLTAGRGAAWAKSRNKFFDAWILDMSVCATWGFKTGNRYCVVWRL